MIALAEELSNALSCWQQLRYFWMEEWKFAPPGSDFGQFSSLGETAEASGDEPAKVTRSTPRWWALGPVVNCIRWGLVSCVEVFSHGRQMFGVHGLEFAVELFVSSSEDFQDSASQGRLKVQVRRWSAGTGCVYWASGALWMREEITHAQNPRRMQNWEDLQIPERTERLEKSAGNTKAQFGKCKANPSGGDRGMAAARRGCCELLGAAGLGKAFRRCLLKCLSLLGRG